jgi:hypothetical protein
MVVMIKELKGKEERRITIPGTHPSSAFGNEADGVSRVAVFIVPGIPAGAEHSIDICRR